MKKADVLAAINRRKQEASKAANDPKYSKAMQQRAATIHTALVHLQIEIEDMGTKREGRDYPPII